MEETKIIENPKNSRKLLIILLILFILASLTLGGYIVYDKLINNKKEDEKKEIKENNEAIDNQKEEDKEEVVDDTTKTMTSKEISLLIKKYDLEGILSDYKVGLGFESEKFSKQSVEQNAKNVMIRFMIDRAIGQSFVCDDIHGTGIDIKLTKEEDEFRDSVLSTAYMYISDFNKYIKDEFKTDIVINNNDTLVGYGGCPSMNVFKDKIYLTYQCGITAGEEKDIYTSFIKGENKIYLYGIIFQENNEENKTTRVKYTFENNGKIWELKEVEPLEIIH